MPIKIFLYTQPGCLSCEIMRIFLEAKEIVYEERDMGLDPAARAELLDTYHTQITPTLVIFTATGAEVIEGFDPDRVDRFLSTA